MAPPVGGMGGMDAIGAMLGNQQGASPGGAPPGGAQASAPPAMGPGGAGAGAQLQLMQQAMGRVRQIGDEVKLLGEEFPQASATAQQIQQLLKQLVIEMAPAAPAQTPSSMAVPGGGMAP